ncbi:MAG: S8 family serine peptidase [Actinobacteria bacterium]|nr:S8 family serine peptidase [Actinomycetota bacterium]MCB9411252.1 S8 family serine peptidase [Actinomycetota bacterium]
MAGVRLLAAAVGAAAIVVASPTLVAAVPEGIGAGLPQVVEAADAPEPAPEVLIPDGDPLRSDESTVRDQVAPGETIEVGVATSDGGAGLSISTIRATGPEEALAVIDAAAARPDTLAVGIPQPIVTFGESAATTTPAATDPYRPENLVLPFPWNQYAPDMLCTDPIAGASSRYGCSNYAWQYATGAEQVVAVLDQGVDTTHPDLAASIVPGASCDTGGCTLVAQTAPENRTDHGTHVAGTIGAITGNGIGVSGMAPGARVMPVEVIPPSGSGDTTTLARGIDWAVDNGATVLNMSLGTLGSPSDPVLEVAVAHAQYLDAVLVAAVGNDGPTTNRISYPAAYPDVIGVGNIDSAKNIASSSTRGNYVDVVAPGTATISTVNVGSPEWGRYGWFSGTSMATPHVTAAMALLRQHQPAMTRGELANLLTSTAQDLGTPGWDSTYGYGLIRPVNALQFPVKPVTPAGVGSVFYPIDPARVLDTRTDPTGQIAPREAREVFVGAEAGSGAPVVPDGAVAIAYNLTIPNPAVNGHLRVMPGSTAYTAASAINVAAGQNIANGLVVQIDAYREIRVYNALGQPADAVVDVLGYFLPQGSENPPGGSLFNPIDPTRVHDSDVSGGRLQPGETRVIGVHTGIDGQQNVVPVGTEAIAYNITVVEPGSAGHLRVMPGDVKSTESSAINWLNPMDKIANGLVVKVAPDRTIAVYNAAGTDVRILVDVVGYYTDTGQLFYPISPARAYDSRQPQPQPGAMLPGTERAVYVGDGRDGVGNVTSPNVVPAGASAMAYNITVPLSAPSPGGHLRLWPDGIPKPNASVINWPVGGDDTRANGLLVGISDQRWVRVYNGSSASNHVIVDVLGYYQ